MKNFSKPVSIVALVAQIALWVATALMLAAFAWTFVNPVVADSPFIGGIGTGTVHIMGVTLQDAAGQLAAFRGALFYGFLAMGLCAMIARNVTLISRSLAKGDQIGEDGDAFSPDNVRMVREIGIFAILVSVLGLIASIVIRAMAPAVEVSAGLDGILLGLVVLYLSTIFAYGHKLEGDVEGLV